tara:strand:- start:236 stop:346 length:111 start_codon:yes stop_codon:yes gene_type:complete
MSSYWDSEYPTHIEVPEDYWVFSHNVEYSSKENKND